MNQIPILLYHGITTSASQRMAPFSVTPDDFARHMDLLVQKGFRCLTTSQFVDERHNLAADDKVAVVTFDDGYADFVTDALPVLAERDIPVTMYLTSGWLDGGTAEPTSRPTDKMLDWSQIPALVDAGVEVGAHSHSHPHMDTLDAAAAVSELTRSKALIEDSIGRPVRSFAYPHGYNSGRTRLLTSEAGYESATAVRNLFSHRTDDVYKLARLMLMNDTTVDTVTDWLDGKGVAVATNAEDLRTVGWRAYRRTKAFISRRAGTEYS